VSVDKRAQGSETEEGMQTKETKMTSDYLSGEIRHAGKVRVEASSAEEAIEKARRGEFAVEDEYDSMLAFDWDGEEVED
jgi:hypothetical protein